MYECMYVCMYACDIYIYICLDISMHTHSCTFMSKCTISNWTGHINRCHTLLRENEPIIFLWNDSRGLLGIPIFLSFSIFFSISNCSYLCLPSCRTIRIYIYLYLAIPYYTYISTYIYLHSSRSIWVCIDPSESM